MPINSFKGEFAFLSNFYPARIEFEGRIYPTLEHAFQAAKFDDPKQIEFVRIAPKASDAKKRGHMFPARVDWDSLKLSVMEKLVMMKFSREPLKSMLLATGEAELIEGNWWGDIYWGVCDGVGENNLGKILMETRKQLRVL